MARINGGMTYAYDFYRLEDKHENTSWHRKSHMHYCLGQVRLSDAYGWGEPIYSPVDGVVREVVSSVKEPRRLNLVCDVGRILLNGLFFSYERGEVAKLSGNYLIIENEQCCALLAHAKKDSIKPEVGDVISAGQHIADVGHSGNSSVPHLHFQIMDRVDVKAAQGLPCCFSTYDIRTEKGWEKVDCGVPGSQFRIRF